MAWLHECVEEVNHTEIVVKEHGRKATFMNANASTFRRVRVDGCLIKDGIRSDWMVTKAGVGSVFVELKGSDVSHALEQLIKTESHSACKSWREDSVGLLVVCSKVPASDYTYIKRAEQARKKGYRLKVVSGHWKGELEQLIAK